MDLYLQDAYSIEDTLAECAERSNAALAAYNANTAA